MVCIDCEIEKDLINAIKELLKKPFGRLVLEKMETKTDNTVCPYIQLIDDDITARAQWSKKDDEIQKRRLGERPKMRMKPYKGAPNAVVNIIDDICTKKTDQEITMILNAPLIAHFYPLGECPQDIALKAQKAFDTYLRHVIGYRAKKEEAVDTKNARGFAVTKVIKTESDYGVIPDFETLDPKDVIVPVTTRVPVADTAERITSVLRLTTRELRQRVKKKGWSKIAVDNLLDTLKAKSSKDDEGTGVQESQHDTENPVLLTEKLVGVNASDYRRDKIVVWEVCHYATDWDVENDQQKRLILDERCITFVCPDVPKLLLKAMPWTIETTEEVPMSMEEMAADAQLAMMEQRPALTVKQVPITKPKPWPYIQHRYEFRSRVWYDSRGIGETCMDNQLTATAMMNAKLTWMDFASNLLFEQDGSGSNVQNFKITPGATLPQGLKIATPPSPPSSLDFDIDYHKRDASQRAGAGDSIYSSEVNSRRTLVKTAEQVRQESSQQGLISSASVDRFNAADIELFKQLWAGLKENKTKLPMIFRGKYEGIAPEEIYSFDFLIVPAASSKTLNPDQQFYRASEAFQLAATYAGQTPVRLTEGLDYVLNWFDPSFADLIMMDPNKAGDQGQPPIYKILEQLTQMITELGAANQEQDKEIEAGLKLADELAGKVEESELKAKQEKKNVD